VDDRSGKPLAGTEVGLAPVSNRDALQITTTAGDGRFVFSVPLRGKYALTARRRGYQSQSFDQHGAYSSSIAAGPNLKDDDLVFRLHPESGISGRVLDTNNEPVASAFVTLLRKSSDENGIDRERIVHSVNTDDLGAYHFRRLEAGSYLISVAAQP